MKKEDFQASSPDQDELSLALGWHGKGEVSKAEAIYKRLYETNNEKMPVFLFQNYGSILKDKGELDKALEVYREGLKRDELSSSIWNNMGGAYVEKGELYGALYCFRKASALNANGLDPRLSMVKVLISLEHKNLALKVCLDICTLPNIGNTVERVIGSLVTLLCDSDIIEVSESVEVQNLVKGFKEYIVSNIERFNWVHLLPLAHAFAVTKDCKNAEEVFSYAEKRFVQRLNDGRLTLRELKVWNNSCWNMSIYLLKNGAFQLGWKLFDYGLRVPAKGRQKYQRAFARYYSNEEVPIWNGERKEGLRLLVYAEQGIGDTMMFFRLLEDLVGLKMKITVYLQERLKKIYERSYPEIRFLSDAKEKPFSKNQFDYQIPSGSLPQFFNVEDLLKRGPRNLRADAEKTKQFRKRYLEAGQGKKIIGFSWQSGLMGKRLTNKSISLDKLLPIFKKEGYLFVSIQYGNDAKLVRKFADKYKLDNVIHDDESSDAISEMDKWMAQVAACDAVFSVANTSVHGSGNLGVPTLCMVTKFSDWRWLYPELRSSSYWYENVSCIFQGKNDEWPDLESEFDRFNARVHR